MQYYSASISAGKFFDFDEEVCGMMMIVWTTEDLIVNFVVCLIGGHEETDMTQS